MGEISVFTQIKRTSRRTDSRKTDIQTTRITDRRQEIYRRTDGQTVSQTDRDTDRETGSLIEKKGGPTDTSNKHNLIDLSGDPDQ